MMITFLALFSLSICISRSLSPFYMSEHQKRTIDIEIAAAKKNGSEGGDL
jgi:hypothetical protein